MGKMKDNSILKWSLNNNKNSTKGECFILVKPLISFVYQIHNTRTQIQNVILYSKTGFKDF